MDTLDTHAWLADHGDYLFRMARRQLHSDALAEDAVQETLLAAISAQARYAGHASPRTWLTGILKHKIVDAVRRASRDGVAPDPGDEADLDALLYDRRGHWAEPPAAWPDPDASLEQAQFFAVLELCLERLPAKTAQAFMMREHLGFETADICKELGVTPTHCWVLLYRARAALRECLQTNWFQK